jgi:hypothetical protein
MVFENAVQKLTLPTQKLALTLPTIQTEAKKPAQPAPTPAQTAPQPQNASILDQYIEKQTRNAQAQKTQNLNAARLGAQQTAAINGYDPAMASRAMFEQTAGAHQANQNIDDSVADAYFAVAQKKDDQMLEMLDKYRELNPQMYQAVMNEMARTGSTDINAAWNSVLAGNGGNPLKPLTPMETQYNGAMDVFDQTHKNATTEEREEFSQLVLNSMFSQSKMDIDNTGNAAVAEANSAALSNAKKIISGEDISSMSSTDIVNAMQSELSTQVKNALSSKATNASYGNLQNANQGDIVSVNGSLVLLTKAPSYGSHWTTVAGIPYKNYQHVNFEFINLETGEHGSKKINK